MKKNLFLAFVLLIALSFLGCPTEDDSPTMDEDYAGDWFGYWGYDYVMVELTDTTYESSLWTGSKFVPDVKGEVKNLGDGELKVTVTHYYDSGWESMSEESYVGSYYVSEDGDDLTLYGTPEGTVYLSSTNSQ